MTFYIRVWSQNGFIPLVQSMETPIGSDIANIVPSVVIDAEVEGPYMGSDEVLAAMHLEGTLLSIAGREIVFQEASIRDGEPDPIPVPRSISFAQLLIGLVTEQWITVEEGRAWRDRVALPAQVQAVIDALPPEQQFAAETRALAPSEVLRMDPLVVSMGAAAGKTPEEIDDFFRTYAAV